MKHYLGFAIRNIEREAGIFFKRKEKEEVFSKVRVSADNFAEAQQMLCDKMAYHNMTIAFVFPYTEEGLNSMDNI